ncbi:conserved hypothetical protein [Burkholderiales bacterium 8X]|nr:conserved hypothetical protein [Burkholderiales bacterium 8X]
MTDGSHARPPSRFANGGAAGLAAALALLFAGAFGTAAHAEGGLPGSPRAIDAATAARSTAGASAALQTAAGHRQPSMTQDASTPPESLGGAIFNPFSDPSATRASPIAAAPKPSSLGFPDHDLVLVAAAGGLAAIAWLLLKDA